MGAPAGEIIDAIFHDLTRILMYLCVLYVILRCCICTSELAFDAHASSHPPGIHAHTSAQKHKRTINMRAHTHARAHTHIYGYTLVLSASFFRRRYHALLRAQMGTAITRGTHLKVCVLIVMQRRRTRLHLGRGVLRVACAFFYLLAGICSWITAVRPAKARFRLCFLCFQHCPYSHFYVYSISSPIFHRSSCLRHPFMPLSLLALPPPSPPRFPFPSTLCTK